MIDKKKAIELRIKGYTYQEIADVFGVTKQRIHQRLTGYHSKGSKQYRDRRRTWQKEYQVEYRHSVIGREIITRSRHRADAIRKETVMRHYGDGKIACIECGFKDIRALSIDHIAGGGNAHRRAIGVNGANFYRWLIKNSYPKGYQTLCMNCQWIKRNNDNKL